MGAFAQGPRPTPHCGVEGAGRKWASGVLTFASLPRFSRTCESLGAGGYRCTACEPGYTGQYCEQ